MSPNIGGETIYLCVCLCETIYLCVCAQWFWASIQMDACADEIIYLCVCVCACSGSDGEITYLCVCVCARSGSGGEISYLCVCLCVCGCSGSGPVSRWMPVLMRPFICVCVCVQWFWASIQMDACADESMYNFELVGAHSSERQTSAFSL